LYCIKGGLASKGLGNMAIGFAENCNFKP